jgi:hypothetical protein
MLKSGLFQKQRHVKRNESENQELSAVSEDTAVEYALLAEVEARSKPIKRNRLFICSQEKKWISKRMFK